MAHQEQEQTPKKPLYVGDLDPETTETDLLQTFREVGEVSSVHLCRDAVTGKSLRYAYVNFPCPSDASKAMACLNHTDLKGKPMRIMWSQRDNTLRKNGLANLFVKNLDPSITSSRLQDIFGTFGNILSCKVATEKGRSKGFGFVQFDSEESAVSAINRLHDTTIEGRKLYVSRFVKGSVRKSRNEEPVFTNLYVKNLSEDLTEDLLRDKFSMFGKISSISIMKNSEGKSRGFGFVNFASADDAGKALETLNGTLLGSKKLFVGRAQMKAEREEMLSCNSQKVSGLFVKNLAKSIDENQLEKHFNACGRVTSVKIMRYDNGVSKGFGFVHFSSPEGARKALATLNGTILQGKPLFIAIPRCKEETQRVLPSYCAEYPVSSLCSSSWDVSSLQFNPLLYNLPYDPLFTAANYHQPIAYQTFLRNADTLYPWTPEIYSHDISTCVSTRQMWQQNNKGWTCQYQSTARDQGNRGRWNSGFRKRGYRRGSMEYCTKGPSVTGHTGGMTEKNMSEVLNPLDQNLQLEDARKTKGMLLEMNNCDLIKLLNSPKSLAFHVDKAVRAQ